MANKTKKRNPLVRLVTLIVTLALLLGAGTVVIFRDELNFDALVRAIRYRSIERTDVGQAASFEHRGRDTDSYALLDGNLLICSANYLRLYSQSGTLYLDENITLNHPIIRTNGKHAIVFDAGGSEFFLVSGRNLVYRESLSGGRTIISAAIAANGQYAITATERGYKGVVSVYRSAGNLAATYKRSSEFVADCALSDDGSVVALLTIGQDGSSFCSNFDFYAQGESEPFSQVELLNNVVIDLVVRGNTFWAVGENALTMISATGQIVGSYDYTNGYLKNYSVDGDGFAALLIGRYRAGSLGSLLQIGLNGEVLGEETINEQVLSLSCAGRYTAVLTYDQLSLYTEGFAAYASNATFGAAKRVLARSDGTALLIADRSAQLYLPE